MNRVFVLDTNKQPLAPCTPKRARELMEKGKAAAYRYNPFTIILKKSVELDVQDNYSINLDPGAVTTGLAIIGHFPKQGNVVIYGAEITHRSHAIKSALYNRRNFRAGRRNRNLRYRQPRFDNRTRKEGWLPPSIESRSNCITNFVKKFKSKISNVTTCNIELPKFDTQKMNNPNISNHQYQQGPLSGYDNVKEYLIDRDGKSCYYCGATGVKLEKEHVKSRAKGSNSVSNLVLSCRSCNEAKSNKNITEFVTDENKLNELKRRMPQWAAAAMNSMRTKLLNDISSTGLQIGIYAGYQTHYNRTKLEHEKEHWIDAACVGDNIEVHIPDNMKPVKIKAMGRGQRRVVNNDKFGFPRINKDGSRIAAGRMKRIHGFSTGDYVRLNMTRGNYIGLYIGRLMSINKRGSLALRLQKPIEFIVNGTSKIKSQIDGKYINFVLIQHSDGYQYSY